MPTDAWSQLGVTSTEAWLTVVTATGIYVGAIALSRVFGQRQFATSSSYDLVFVFALGSVLGRVVLVRTSLAAAVLGLATLFVLHAATGWLHHNVRAVHELIQNPPILLVADGEVVEEGMRRAHLSRAELHQALRLHGHGTLRGLRAVILERSGSFSILPHGVDLDPDMLDEIAGGDRLRRQADSVPADPTVEGRP